METDTSQTHNIFIRILPCCRGTEQSDRGTNGLYTRMRSSGEVASAVAFVCHTVMDGGFPVDHELLSAELERLCNDRFVKI